MYNRIRTSLGIFAATIAAASCSPAWASPEYEAKRELCTATAELAASVLSIDSADKEAQDQFIVWFYSRPAEVQAFLLPYFKLAVQLAQAQVPLPRIAAEVYGVCIGRKA